MSELDGLKLLRRIEEGVAGKFGEAFFKQIVCDLSGALNAHAAFAARLNDDKTGSMLAYWVEDHFDKCLTYSLQGTPCEFVYKGQITSFARDIGNIFPVDREWFASLGVNSYLGIPIKGETGEVVGHLAVMDRRERDWREADVDVLRLFSLRTAVELERANSHKLLEQSNQALADANSRLTEEIERRAQVEKDLAAAKLSAEMANQAKSVFISQMSHELRTPLNGILGYTQLMKRSDESLSVRQRDGLQVIERSGEHLLTLVNDLLDLAKIEAGRLDLVPADLDLRETLEHVGDLIGERARHAQLGFSVDMGSASIRVYADGRALRQVLLNLLGNAIKYTQPRGMVGLRVHTEPFGRGQQRVTFQVNDTGIGIPAEELNNIFEPFHRVTDGRGVAEGTGLGLTIARRLVSAMGGTLEVRSTVGVGSVFEFTVLFRVVGASHAYEPARSSVRAYRGERKRVLLVDDDPVNRKLLCGLLQDLGFTVATAEDGSRAREVLAGAAPDIIITDLLMPNVGGDQLLQWIRDRSATADLPVIALSASAASVAHRNVSLDGFDAFLTKPVRFDDLLDCIQRLLSLEWVRESNGGASATMARDGTNTRMNKEFIAEVEDLAMRGDVQALILLCERSATDSQDARTFFAQLKPYALNYDTVGIRRIVASWRSCESPDGGR